MPDPNQLARAGAAERPRVLVWYSSGAASALAAKVAIERYANEATVEICKCDTSSDEHPDNARFDADIERWCGRTIKRLTNPKYKTVDEVFRGERYIVGPIGASCTKNLKRLVREKYQRPGDRHVFGYTADEANRIASFESHHPDLTCLWLLAQAGITKEDCYHVLSANGIELPAMYRLGYDHNNCVGCVKGGKGYWNKIRRDFPEAFARRAKVQREIGAKFGGADGFFLDELGPDEGRDVPEPPIECGVFCDHYTKLVDLGVRRAGAA